MPCTTNEPLKHERKSNDVGHNMNLFRRITDICGAGNNGSWKYAPCGASPNCVISIKGPANPTCQLLPIMSNKSCSGTGKEGKTKEVVKDREVKTVVCDCGTKLYAKDGA